MSKSNFILVGISAYKRSGKDTSAVFLARSLRDYEYKKIAFADSLKDELCNHLHIDRKFLDENKEQFREYLQFYGQKQKELCGQFVWVTELAKKVSEFRKEGKKQLVIVPDVRFPFEASWILENNGYLIKVERFEKNEDLHPSETEVDKIRGADIIIPNKGGIRDFERECKYVAAFIRDRYE